MFSSTASASRTIWWAMLALLLLYVVLVIVLSPSANTVGVYLLLGLAAGVAGWLIGFLFGIPHTAAAGAMVAPAPALPPAGPAAMPGPLPAPTLPPAPAPAPFMAAYRPSTNLEQVADWLTKIIIGIGLVKADALAVRLQQVGVAVGTILKPTTTPAVVAVDATTPQIVVLSFAGLGFFAGYYWTRLIYTELQVQADASINWFLTQLQDIRQKNDLHSTEIQQTAENLKQLGMGNVDTAVPTTPAPATTPVQLQTITPGGGGQAASAANPVVAQFLATPGPDPGQTLFGTTASAVGGLVLRVQLASEQQHSATQVSGAVLRATVVASSTAVFTGPVRLLLPPGYQQRVLAKEAMGSTEATATLLADRPFRLVALAETSNGLIILAFDLRQVPQAPPWLAAA